MTCHGLCCTHMLFSISVHGPGQPVALLEQGGWTRCPPEVSANRNQSAIPWSTSNVQGHTLRIQTQILLRSPGGRSAAFLALFPVLLSRSWLRTLLAVSILPSASVPQCPQESWSPGTQPGWAENPRHVTSSFWSFRQMHPIRSIECGWPYHLFLTRLEGFRALNKLLVEDNFRNLNNIHCSLAKLCIEVTVCVCPAWL